MKRPSPGALAGGVAGVALLAAVGAFVGRHPEPGPAAASGSVAAGGVTLVSASITLPDETESLPAGPHADLVRQHCTACHSAGMILSQPPLPAKQWQAEVTKMREAYHAPVPASDEPAIVAYLTALGTGGRGQ